jgi:serine/threonine kinase PknH
MRQLTAAVAGICILAAGCSSCSNHTTSTTAPPVAEAALEGLLLSPADINTAMGAIGMTASQTNNRMEDHSAAVSDKDCLFVAAAAEAPVYAGSGWTAVCGQYLTEPGAGVDHLVAQVVVSFPSANDAGAFFTASAQHWPACSNRRFTRTAAGQPSVVLTVGPVTNTNGTLSVTQTEGFSANSWTCQQALTVANNVAIDVRHAAVDSCSQSDPRSQHRASDRRQSTHNVLTFRQLTPPVSFPFGGPVAGAQYRAAAATRKTSIL